MDTGERTPPDILPEDIPCWSERNEVDLPPEEGEEGKRTREMPYEVCAYDLREWWRHYYERRQPYQPFKITVCLATPLAGYDYPHLSALVQAGVVYDAMKGCHLAPNEEPYQVPMPMQPIWKWHWINSRGEHCFTALWNASTLLPEGAVMRQNFWWVKRPDDPGDWARLGAKIQRRKDGRAWAPNTTAGTNKGYRMPLPTTGVTELVGYGYGDMAEIGRLLSYLPGMGKKVAIGFGWIAGITIEPCAAPGPDGLCILASGGEDGVYRLLHPVPLASLPELGLVTKNDNHPGIVRGGWAPPYWMPAHSGDCLPEGALVQAGTATSVTRPSGAVSERETLPAFLLRCAGREEERHTAYQFGQGIGAYCALTGAKITDGAVPTGAVISSDTGDVLGLCAAPGAPWISNAAAILMNEPKVWSRGILALDAWGDSPFSLIWPTLAPNPDRPLWRDALIALATRHQAGRRCCIMLTLDSKVRRWPLARIGRVGAGTPLFVHAIDAKHTSATGDPGFSRAMTVHIGKLAGAILLIESVLALGFGKRAIRTGLFTGLDAARKIGLQETDRIEHTLEPLRSTPEFYPAWLVARGPEKESKTNAA